MQNKLALQPLAKIFKDGEKATKLYLVKRGQVLCLKLVNDRMIPIFRAQEGDIVGENAMMQDSHYGYSAVALTNVELLEIPAANFSEVLKTSPTWLVDLTSTMVNRFQNTANLIAENRVIHPSVIEESEFTSSMETSIKKILA